MVNFDDPIGRRVLERLHAEQVIWLTTVSGAGAPQPRPVWFVWDGASILIYSQPAAHKVAHVAANPRVALNFNATADGDDVQVILGRAEVAADAPPPGEHPLYLAKYRQGIKDIGLDEARYSAMFSLALRIVPTRVRGLDPLPDQAA